jgi:ribonuclease VapC
LPSLNAQAPAVFDSSAILALLLSEPGGDRVLSLLEGGYLSTVNLIEVHARMITLGADPTLAWNRVLNFQCQICPLTEAQARVAAELLPATRPYGLSLGDRVCLALAIERQAKVYTTDRIWKQVSKNLSIGIEIEVIG